jgi:hypothetical protein
MPLPFNDHQRFKKNEVCSQWSKVLVIISPGMKYPPERPGQDYKLRNLPFLICRIYLAIFEFRCVQKE